MTIFDTNHIVIPLCCFLHVVAQLIGAWCSETAGRDTNPLIEFQIHILNNDDVRVLLLVNLESSF